VIGINRTIVGIIGLGRIVTPGWRPKAVVQEIPSTGNEHEVGAVICVPPVMIVPFAVVISKRGIMCALPIFCAVNVIVVLIGHTLDVRLRPAGNIVVVLRFPLCFIRLPAGNFVGVVRQILTLIALVRDVGIIRIVGVVEALVALVSFVTLVRNVWIIGFIGIIEPLVAFVLVPQILILPSRLDWTLGVLVLLPLLFLLVILVCCGSDQWDRQTANEYGK